MKKLLTCVLAFTLSLCVFTACGGMNNYAGAPGMGGAYDAETGYGNELTGEDYTEIIENDFVSTAEKAQSFFSIDANSASYPNLRSLINRGYSVPKDAVRAEEMLNYFDYDYQTPQNGDVLALTASMFDNPYNAQTKLLTVGLAAQEVEFSQTKNNLVFLIDVSGSMSSEDKLPLVQEAFRMLTENLGAEDRISIVTYASSDKVALSGAYGYETQKIVATIEDLYASGSTAGSKGIQTAYELAKQYYIEGGNNRVILATDGDFNVGITGNGALESFIAEKAKSGVYFSVFGFGRGNIQSSKMESLALKGNGAYSYIDSQQEARRALVEEINGTLVTVAKDVKAGITFNGKYIDSYLLIGYDNKLLTEEEFESDGTDAGELGSGHKVTIVYEVKLTETAFVGGEELASVAIKYKPTENSGGLQEDSETLTLGVGVEAYHAERTAQDDFIASVIEFALLLRDSAFKADASFASLIERLTALDLSGDELKAEFRELVSTYYEGQKRQ